MINRGYRCSGVVVDIKGASQIVTLGLVSTALLFSVLLFSHAHISFAIQKIHWKEGTHEFYNDSNVYFDIYPETTRGEPVNKETAWEIRK